MKGRNKIFKQCIEHCYADLHKNPEFYDHLSSKHWTFIIHNGQIVSKGTNKLGTNIFTNFGYKHYQGLHSEQTAFKRAKGALYGQQFSIVNIRFNSEKSLSMSKPCKCCLGFLKFFGCSEIYYSTTNGFVKLK